MVLDYPKLFSSNMWLYFSWCDVTWKTCETWYRPVKFTKRDCTTSHALEVDFDSNSPIILYESYPESEAFIKEWSILYRWRYCYSSGIVICSFNYYSGVTSKGSSLGSYPRVCRIVSCLRNYFVCLVQTVLRSLALRQ